MTDADMKKFFDSLLRDKEDYDDMTIAFSMLTAAFVAGDAEGLDNKTRVSER